ncbi:MAG: hypothetical protein ACLFP2_04540 [Candidatus Woesearchaeota archaeon]
MYDTMLQLVGMRIDENLKYVPVEIEVERSPDNYYMSIFEDGLQRRVYVYPGSYEEGAFLGDVLEEVIFHRRRGPYISVSRMRTMGFPEDVYNTGLSDWEDFMENLFERRREYFKPKD